MQMKRVEKTGAWEITGSKEEMPEIGKFLQAAAFEGVGAKEKKLSVSINGHAAVMQSNRELWMLGYGLEVGQSEPKAIKPEKEKVRVASVKKEEETPFSEWDKDFKEAAAATLTEEIKT